LDGAQKTGLILTGGGARAAYQVGVLKAIAEMLPRRAQNPFPIICGTSAGAFNAVTLAVYAQSFRLGAQYLEKMWKNFTAHDIYRADPLGVLKNTILWMSGLVFTALGINRLNHVSLLDSSPLAELLDRAMPSEKIQENIDAGALHALSISASGYGTGQSVNFFQSVQGVQPWQRARRIGVSTFIEAKHILASSAIPFIFPAVKINREYFGDGSMRQIAPISPALHLGAVRVLVIGTGQTDEFQPGRSKVDDYPSLAKIAGHAMDSIFLDSLEVDIERLSRINKTIDLVSMEVRQRLSLSY
jgi:NTE family protein